MKLVIAATPKSGNHWLKYLLREVYRLPIVELPSPFSEEKAGALPDRWVGHEHYRPSGPLMRWGESEGVVFLTTVRHPGDVLLSLYHFTRAYPHEPRWNDEPIGVMRHDLAGPGEHVLAAVRDGFARYLEVSAEWMANGRSIVVRYEDLCRDPEGEMERVVRAVHARRPEAGLPLDRVAGAVAACEIGMLRKGLGLDPSFFRKGGAGDWVKELPPSILEAFRSLPPYPEMFARLGYSTEPELAERRAPRAGSVANPFEGLESFEDGTRILPFLARLFVSLDDRTRGALHPLAGLSDPASFLSWLGAPAAEDPQPGKEPLVTNLALAIHARREDVQRLFPDPFGRDRLSFVEWFVHNAGRDHGLDPRLVSPVRDSFAAVLAARSRGSG
jgi:hypothetical protein